MSKLDEARKKTDRKLEQLEKKLAEVYKTAETEIRKSWDSFMEEQNAYIKDLQDAYYSAKNAGFEDEARKLGKQLGIEKRKRILQNQYYQDMVNEVTTQLAHINETALSYINGEIPEFYTINRNGANEYINEYIADYRFDLMDAHTARRLLTDSELYADMFKSVNVPKDKRWNRKLIHSQVTQGIIQGESIEKIADRIQNVTDANRASAIRNARTMCTTAESRGRMDSYEEAEAKGIMLKKRWIATADKRTRDWHAILDGVEEEIDDPFENEMGFIMYPGDTSANPANYYNCRCAIATRIIGFKRKDGSISYVEDEEYE